MDYAGVLEEGKKQLESEIKLLKEVIKHNGGKGTAAEQALKTFLRNHLPKKYTLNKGFVVNNGSLSPYHDLIVYDENINVPILSAGEDVYLAGGAVYGAIETTLQELELGKLSEDIEKLGKLRSLFPKHKVGFRTFATVPVIAQEHLSIPSLPSGITFDDVWNEGIKKGYWNENGIILGKLEQEELVLNYMTPEESRELKDQIIKNRVMSKHTVVQEKEIYSSPLPRTYICALAGTEYKNPETLLKNIKELTAKYGAHLHGLLVLGAKDTDDWLFANVAYSSEISFESGKVTHKFLASMIKGFNGMLVGKFPAIM